MITSGFIRKKFQIISKRNEMKFPFHLTKSPNRFEYILMPMLHDALELKRKVHAIASCH